MLGEVALKIVSTGTIFSQIEVNHYYHSANYNFNHAPNIVTMPDGKLFVVWFSGPWEGHPFQLILCSSSKDNGISWKPAEVFQDTSNVSDFDPAFIKSEDRVFFIHSVAQWCKSKSKEEKEGFLGNYIKYTEDSGKTWIESKKLSENLAQRMNGITLSNGDLLLSYYTQTGCAGVIKSLDDGKTWEKQSDIKGPIKFSEPTIVELMPGKLLIYLRSQSKYIWKTVSNNYGETWSEPCETDIIANDSSHCLYRLKNGKIILIYNPCEPKKRTPLVLRASNDHGDTWGPFLLLDQINDRDGENQSIHPSGSDYAVTYPSVTENEIGKIIVVWAKYKITTTEHLGEILFAKLTT